MPPITKTIQVRRNWHAGHCWRSRDGLISDVLLWTPTYSRAKAGRPARTYIQQLCEDTGCSPEDLPEAMNDREKWREEGQGYPCYQHMMMMMMMMMMMIKVKLKSIMIFKKRKCIYFCGLFVLISVFFVLFLLSLRFGQISPLAFFRWLTVTSDRNAESCNRNPSNYCLL